MADCEIDIVREIYNNKTGVKFVVRPDGDGLNLVEIIGEGNNRIILYPDEARFMSDALYACADEIDSRKEEPAQ